MTITPMKARVMWYSRMIEFKNQGYRASARNQVIPYAMHANKKRVRALCRERVRLKQA
ncbi:hypothetical protein [Paraburkholderia humisilvae]|uniref:hypothetical protein n=1 Tax=Paraburkholderia humisilvae TaxID=627669 RepID=UPI003612A6A0